jgi:hypothetical protein
MTRAGLESKISGQALRHRIGRLALCASVIACLGGCLMVTRYPDDWPSIRQASGPTCPNISGRYADEEAPRPPPLPAARSPVPSPPQTLSSVLVTGPLRRAQERPTSAEFRLEGDSVLHIAWYRESMLTDERKLVRQNGDFSCAEGMLSIPMKLTGDGGSVGGVSVLFASKEHLHLTAVDSYVVARRSATGGGVILAVPIAAYMSGWSRYPAVRARVD